MGMAILACALQLSAATNPQIEWDNNRVTASVEGARLREVLQRIADETGWQVYVEPGAKRTVTSKFKARAVGEALNLLLGDLSFVRVPAEGDKPARLYVFRTSRDDATQLINPVLRKRDSTGKPIPNELVVKLKCGTDPEQVARRVGAKVVGRADAACTYRFRFETAEAADAARSQLDEMPEVEAIDSNYHMRRPELTDGFNLAGGPSLDLKPRQPGDCSSPIVGLIDTAVQMSGGPSDMFLLPGLEVAGPVKAPLGEPTHGTGMANALLQGLAAGDKTTGAKVLPVDVYGPNTSTTTFDVANGIVQAINKGATVINLSLGSAGDSDFLRDIIRQGSEQGVLFLAAAGNEPTAALTYPAAYPNVLAVTAGAKNGGIAPYANFGDFVDLAAPGSSLFNFQGQNWMVMGTSVSTAYASGIAAGMWDCNKMTAAQLGAAMQKIMPVKR